MKSRADAQCPALQERYRQSVRLRDSPTAALWTTTPFSVSELLFTSGHSLLNTPPERFEQPSLVSPTGGMPAPTGPVGGVPHSHAIYLPAFLALSNLINSGTLRTSAQSLAGIAAKAGGILRGRAEGDHVLSSTAAQCEAVEREAVALGRRCGDEIRIAFLGIYSSGKSSLINSVIKGLGVDPEQYETVRREVSLAPTDDLVTLVQHRDVKRCENSADIQITLHDVDALRDVILIDTPGWGNDPVEERIGRGAIAEADVIVQVINASHAMPSATRAIFDSELAEYAGLPIVYVFAHCGAYLVRGKTLDERSARELTSMVRAEVRRGFGGGLQDSEMLPRYGRNVFFVDNKTKYGIDKFSEHVFKELSPQIAGSGKLDLLESQVEVLNRRLARALSEAEQHIDDGVAQTLERLDKLGSRLTTEVKASIRASAAEWEAECGTELTRVLTEQLERLEAASSDGTASPSNQCDFPTLAARLDDVVDPLRNAGALRDRLQEGEAESGSFVVDAQRMTEALRTSWGKLEESIGLTEDSATSEDQAAPSGALFNNIRSACRDSFLSPARDRLAAELDQRIAEASDTKRMDLVRAELNRQVHGAIAQGHKRLEQHAAALRQRDAELRGSIRTFIEDCAQDPDSDEGIEWSRTEDMFLERASDFDEIVPGTSTAVAGLGAEWIEQLEMEFNEAIQEDTALVDDLTAAALPDLTGTLERIDVARASIDDVGGRMTNVLATAVDGATATTESGAAALKSNLSRLTSPTDLLERELAAVTDAAIERAQGVLNSGPAAPSKTGALLRSLLGHLPLTVLMVALAVTLYLATGISGKIIAGATAPLLLGVLFFALRVSPKTIRGRMTHKRAMALAGPLRTEATRHLHEASAAIERVNQSARTEFIEALDLTTTLSLNDDAEGRFQALVDEFEQIVGEHVSTPSHGPNDLQPSPLRIGRQVAEALVEAAGPVGSDAFHDFDATVETKLRAHAALMTPQTDDLATIRQRAEQSHHSHEEQGSHEQQERQRQRHHSNGSKPVQRLANSG